MTDQTMNPAAGDTASGARETSLSGGHPGHSCHNQDGKAPLTFRLAPDHQPITVTGRLSQTMRLLIQTGPNGFTSGEAAPLGWSRCTGAYAHKLRGLGVPIQTALERAGDRRVGRYGLARPVVVTTIGEPQ